MKSLSLHKKSAKEEFQKAIQTAQTHLPEYWVAKAELAKMDGH
jgi:hypothetical protein